MHRKITALTLISILVCFQYGRILGYIGCSIYNISGKAVKCDCEKQFSNAVNEDTQPATKKFAIKERTEEFFIHHASFAVSEPLYPDRNTTMIFREWLLPAGFSNAVFLPPRC